MKYKKIIFVLTILVLATFVFSTNVFADDFTNIVVSTMKNQQMGATTENDVTKTIRTVYAIIQTCITGATLIYFTAYSTRFFHPDAQKRAEAKKGLTWRVLGLGLVFAVEFILAVIVKWLTP